MDIDMKNFAGATDPVAGGQKDTNTYSQLQSEEYPVYEEFLEKAPDPVSQSPDQVVDSDSPMDQSADSRKQIEEPSAQELNFRALSEEVNRIKAEKDEIRLNLEMMKANMSHQRQEAAPQPRKMFDGMDDSDVPNVSEIRRAWEEREAQYQGRLEELQFQSTHADYAEVLEKHLVPLIKQKPHLASMIRNAPNPAQSAYEIAKMAQAAISQQTQAPVQQQKSATAQKIVDNARKPGTLSQAGGSAVLSKADYYATMSDAEFMKMASKHMGEI